MLKDGNHKRVTISVSPELHAKALGRTQSLGMTLSGYLAHLVRNDLSMYEPQFSPVSTSKNPEHRQARIRPDKVVRDVTEKRSNRRVTGFSTTVSRARHPNVSHVQSSNRAQGKSGSDQRATHARRLPSS